MCVDVQLGCGTGRQWRIGRRYDIGVKSLLSFMHGTKRHEWSSLRNSPYLSCFVVRYQKMRSFVLGLYITGLSREVVKGVE
ncbi:hypothetical protein M378DRAFT_962955 [Amanita muscaria Koide BX008]|uniref:Uncharacterized protein n=1 Tax=Amanita muscaria (strain Koide BX008) TaxID=946122 RepID=A0A0C2WEZ6_AMAMK|nr:hypothetical protein M378DRAFT_962955 [Amanita muscaria Koide BX008]